MKDKVEVIDLARTNLGYEVRELALAALQLEPDIAIVFAGNNWGSLAADVCRYRRNGPSSFERRYGRSETKL